MPNAEICIATAANPPAQLCTNVNNLPGARGTGHFLRSCAREQSARAWCKACHMPDMQHTRECNRPALNSAQPGGPGPVPPSSHPTRMRSTAKAVADSRNRGVRVGRSLGASEEHERGHFVQPAELPPGLKTPFVNWQADERYQFAGQSGPPAIGQGPPSPTAIPAIPGHL